MTNADKAEFLVDLTRVMRQHGCTGISFWQDEGESDLSFDFGDEYIAIDPDLTAPEQLLRLSTRFAKAAS